jgi:hypothetical protein
VKQAGRLQREGGVKRGCLSLGYNGEVDRK